jgi:CubicO group peptidase (beta-lactamase class C family)
MERYDVVGATVVLVDGDEVAYSRGFGWADRARLIPTSADTVYTVSSLTKLFTATAVMQLVEEGKVDLDAPVSTYIPEFRIRSRYPNSDPITVRMLMTHHSGLPSDWGYGLFTKAPMSFHAIVGYLKDNYLSYPPNYILNYSNIGVDLLGLVIEKASGMEYKDYVDKRLLAPLGMSRSWFPSTADPRPGVSRGYRRGKEADEYVPRDLPSTSLYTSGLDLARFAIAMHGRGRLGQVRILGAETIESMWVPQNEGIPMDLNRRIGLMWQLGRQKLDYSGRVCFHHGLSLYHRSTFVMLPDHRLTAIVLTNSDTGDKITERLADEMLRLALEVKEGIKPPPPVKKKVVPLPAAEIARYTGTFATLKGVARIKEDGGRLKMRISGVTLNMIPDDDGYFSLEYRLLGLFPIAISDLDEARTTVKDFGGMRVLVLERDGISAVVGEEIDGKAKIPPRWMKRVGRYRMVSAGDEFQLFDDLLEIEVQDGILSGRLTSDRFDIGTLNLILQPVNDGEALIRGLGRSGRETLFVRTVDGREALEYSGYVFRKVP